MTSGPLFPISNDEMRAWAERCGLPAKLSRELFCQAPFADETPIAKHFRREVNEGRTMLVLSGPTGVGKSTAAGRFMVHLLGQRRRAVWVRAKMLERITPRTVKRLEELETAELLVLDELGEEYLDEKGFLGGLIAGLLCTRYDAVLWTVVTTNMPAADFSKRYGERVVDRIREVGAFIEVGGHSLRAAGAASGFSSETR